MRTPLPVPGAGRRSAHLTDAWQAVQARAFRAVLDRLDARGVVAERAQRTELREDANAAVGIALEGSDLALNGFERGQMVEALLDEIIGLGPLEPLLADPTVEDVIVNGPTRIYVERAGRLQRMPLRFRDDAHVMATIQRIVGPLGRRVDEANPCCDARLADGSRVNIVVPPVALDGPALSIRKQRRVALTANDLVRGGSAPREVIDYLALAVRSKFNTLVIGGTGSGKTTLLNILSGYIDEAERLVTIEDAAELQLHQEHVVRLETRPAGPDGSSAVTARELMRNALRMRPDRIVLGEVRGAEAVEMLQAMSTGHDGSISTLHANSPRDALARLEMLLAFSGLPFEPRALRRFIASSINMIVEVSRGGDGRRRIVHIAELCGVEGETYRLHDVWKQDAEAPTLRAAATAPLRSMLRAGARRQMMDAEGA
ncbi:CpaF family protein [Plastoroseomonas hellenica]|uniref:CpaF family protein n=1 Tax=Plastoroseomonas hellenica TaxID=2687306 RepID=UPI001BA94C6A|nr:CpaF family protein [Plastoroseomonas hellenica]MBR0646326.1 CpaF family protein [Plastoroseomonas hellenica]